MKTAFADEAVAAGLWEQIDALAVSRLWQPGDVVYREGTAPVGVYIVRSGQIDLVYAERRGTVRALRRSTRGDILGLAEAVEARSHGATAIARSPSETGFLHEARLRMLLDDQPFVWFSVLRELSRDVAQSWESLRATR
jgi:CRP-like cAMP-binding protein